MRTSECHEKLDAHGVGKCSVPMWLGGGPAGFCDAPAYGKRERTTWRRDLSGRLYPEDGRYSGYVPALACPHHGGPQVRTFKDGDAWCAVHPDFTNLQESPAGFGDTPEQAIKALEVKP